ncbi:MAG TPA: hypothetical protein VII47_16530 [Actinomycetota bacterium]|jgi:hypothetical protein
MRTAEALPTQFSLERFGSFRFERLGYEAALGAAGRVAWPYDVPAQEGTVEGSGA